MDKAFHYHAVRVLAEKAGFPKSEAQTIAYASQYTDDATEHKPIPIAGVSTLIGYPRYSHGMFDPICTAHGAKSKALDLWKMTKFYLRPAVQRKVLIAFHFMPPKELAAASAQARHDADDAFDFMTVPNGELANKVLERAKNLLNVYSGDPERRDYALVSLGLALHTYADTWAHAGFSGRHNAVENDVKNVQCRKGSRYDDVGILGSIVSYVAPDVGHSEVMSLPDQLGKTWRAEYANKEGTVGRNNAEQFIEASSAIFEHLKVVAPGTGDNWDDVRTRLMACLSKRENWRGAFPELSFCYSRFDWREDALAGDSVDWDNFDDDTDFARLNLAATGNDNRWFWFHKAAYEQRAFIEDRIPTRWNT